MADADKILRELIDKIIAELNLGPAKININPITSDGANYTSALFLAEVTGKDNALNLFAKVAIVGDKMREIMNATTMFGTEVFVYKDLMKVYNDLQDKNELLLEDRFIFPKFYGCNPNIYEETIILENLIAKGYKMPDRFKSVDWDYAVSAISVLAKFHALSFAYEKQNPEEFDRVAKNLIFKRHERESSFKDVWQNMVKSALGVLNEDHRKRAHKLLLNSENLFEMFNKPRGKTVLIHGDFRPSNLLFKSEGENIQTIAVDYQTVKSGCPVADLVYFIAIGSDGAFRAAHFDQLTDRYYLELEGAMSRLGVDAAHVYPREEFEDDLKAMLPYFVFLGIVVLPIVTVQTEQAPRVAGDADGSDFVLEPNQLFAARFTELIADCIRWGVI